MLALPMLRSSLAMVAATAAPISRTASRSAVVRMAGGVASAMPTKETGVAALLQSSPEADGRGTVVAVLDTGCDLAAAGLQTTSDGKPKYVDFIDCTGGGDIDTSKKAKKEADGTVMGLSGRTLKLGAWAEEVEDFRLGALRLFALGSMPAGVLRRIKEERKAAFTAQHHRAVSKLQRELDGLGAEATKEARDDLKLQLEQLDAMMKDYADEGPLLDALLFQEPKCAARPWEEPQRNRHVTATCGVAARKVVATWSPRPAVQRPCYPATLLPCYLATLATRNTARCAACGAACAACKDVAPVAGLV